MSSGSSSGGPPPLRWPNRLRMLVGLAPVLNPDEQPDRVIYTHASGHTQTFCDNTITTCVQSLPAIAGLLRACGASFGRRICGRSLTDPPTAAAVSSGLA